MHYEIYGFFENFGISKNRNETLLVKDTKNFIEHVWKEIRFYIV